MKRIRAFLQNAKPEDMPTQELVYIPEYGPHRVIATISATVKCIDSLQSNRKMVYLNVESGGVSYFVVDEIVWRR